ncbi:ABC transporter substrate-binding protein [Arthrobacter sp. efr-133-TYG-118]|uniref:ABC transporter substrate-binding protein n=1 Tax=Arthrobacter sp. efr-133-TYG-118 TaxID=3040279 RepID=UPI0025503C1E|nr:ABC transporter substrate-binding protein [Arthrobacter sp. efr-133-TYG-118]
MKYTHGLRAAAAAAGAVLLLAGCSAPSSSPSSAAPQTLNLSIQAPPTNFTVGDWSGGDSTLFTSVYDSILKTNVKGEATPGIAESWSYSPDKLVLTLKIRTGQKFSDGEPVDAAAVVASLKQTMKEPSYSAQLATISDVTAPDATTAVITLKTPDASLLSKLGGVQGGVGAPKVLTAKSSSLDPVGSGPYTLDKSATTAGSVYTLKRNPGNWDASSYPFETVKIRVIQDPTASQNALKTGQLDFGGVNPDQVSQFPKSQFTTGTSLPQAVGAIWLADRDGKIVPALKDVRVRQAINMAVDRSSIATKLVAGAHGTEQLVSPTGAAYSADLDKTYPFDVDGAKKLMAEAGYADGFSVKMPSTVVSQAYDATIAQELGAIGIKVTYDTVPFQDFFAKVYGGTYGLYFMYNGFSGDDASDLNGSTSGAFNPYGTTTPELTELLAKANAAPADKQGAAFGAVNKYLVDQAWAAPILSSTGPWVTTSRIKYTPPVTPSLNLLPFGVAASN